MKESGEAALFVEAVVGGKSQHVNAAKLAVGSIADGTFDRGYAIGVGRLPQHLEQGFDIAHRSEIPLTPSRARHK